MTSLDLKKNTAITQIQEFCALQDAQIKALENFVAMLLQENLQFNFIGKSTVDDVWSRHILDSAQLMAMIENKNHKFADLGSGAGFPGIVLSILGLREVHLIEKSFRKSDFLRRAKTISPNRVFVHQAKLEEMSPIEFDCILSRALAPLDTLLGYSKKFLKKNGYCLFLKGKNLPNELAAAQKKFHFDFELKPSITSSESNVIKVSNIITIQQ